MRAASTRRIAATADANSGLISYYFGTLDHLFVELFRRSWRSLDRLRHVLMILSRCGPTVGAASYEPSNNAIALEFIALANHRRALKKEIAVVREKHLAVEGED